MDSQLYSTYGVSYTWKHLVLMLLRKLPIKSWFERGFVRTHRTPSSHASDMYTLCQASYTIYGDASVNRWRLLIGAYDLVSP